MCMGRTAAAEGSRLLGENLPCHSIRPSAQQHCCKNSIHQAVSTAAPADVAAAAVLRRPALPAQLSKRASCGACSAAKACGLRPRAALGAQAASTPARTPLQGCQPARLLRPVYICTGKPAAHGATDVPRQLHAPTVRLLSLLAEAARCPLLYSGSLPPQHILSSDRQLQQAAELCTAAAGGVKLKYRGLRRGALSSSTTTPSWCRS